MTIIIFLIVLAVLVFVHELGHFLVARACGIRVDAFAIGFGPKILAWKKGQTDYRLNLIPLGGYVKIFGEDPDQQSLVGEDSSRSFANQPRWRQALVLFAGVLFNFIFAWILYVGVFTFGVTATTSGFEKYADNFSGQKIMITHVLADSPAEKSGLKGGDIIYSIAVQSSGQTLNIAMLSNEKDDIKNIQELIGANDGRELAVSYVRGQERGIARVIPVKGLVENTVAIGIAMDKVGELRLPFLTAIWESFGYTLVMIKETAIGLYVFVSSIFQGNADFKAVTGPVGIAGIVGTAANLGLTYLIMITAIISINLGVINLVPFPALDGGRLLFVLIEGIFRRRIPHTFANMVNTLGFALLMILMVVVTYKDIVRLFR
ncbi:MAG: hypothetical protein A3B11_01075 [Candidatus Taylorbacteria bacterium RIFCSPLOWO2_01_FULL_44_26]|uniref:Peptidase M50 domain-containing protein n=2 Tax=Candidatus Tayloriibacteriota TaxID=1817919 RepID=A0A1G2MIW6_9BACT|nr:MAG: hypothetical protein A3D50_00855 [Candidatus Taylorbacteria bacterium RIFCSPHIGHO2_02_FULL_44_12]OHA30694.1 MAG: hypothetical protein A3B11_01075 [Candidatus Taylorbacteria bacterium RIFCSPLOWO2_01_FULL_44_26]